MSKAKLFAAQKAAAEISLPLAVINRMTEGNIPRETLPIYFLSDSPLVAAVAKLLYSGQSLDKQRIKKLRLKSKATADSLKQKFLDQVAHDDFKIDIETLSLEVEELLRGFEDELTTLQLIEVNNND